MILRQVREVMRGRGSASISQVMAELGADRGIVAAALSHWERAGRIQRLQGYSEGCSPVACKSCPLVPLCGDRDAAEHADYFVWIEEMQETKTDQEPTASGSFMQSMV